MQKQHTGIVVIIVPWCVALFSFHFMSLIRVHLGGLRSQAIAMYHAIVCGTPSLASNQPCMNQSDIFLKYVTPMGNTCMFIYHTVHTSHFGALNLIVFILRIVRW